MSNPPVQPENAAPLAPVRPSGPAQSPSPSLSKASALDAHAPPPPHTVAAALPNPSPAYVQGLPIQVHEQDIPSHTPNLAQDAQSLLPSNASQTTWSRGPVPQPRSTGPSLLTQALATARATPHGQAELLKSQPTTPRRSQLDSFPPDANQNGHDTPAYQSDGDTVTPRGSPLGQQRYTRPSDDTPSDSTPRQHLVHEANSTPTRNMLDTHEASSMLRAHQDIIGRTRGGGTSLELLESLSNEAQPSMLSQSFDVVLEGRAGGDRPRPGQDQALNQRAPTFNKGDQDEAAAHVRPRKLEHRVTIGPEKAWSIGTGESRDGRDGQVEKSIREVLAGEKPNASSRKASHSLGFFKEGLPEDKSRRKEAKAGTHQRDEKRSASREGLREVRATDGQLSPEPREEGRVPKAPTRTRSSAVQSPKVPPVSESPEDYFLLRTDSSARCDAQPELPFRAKPTHEEPQEKPMLEDVSSQEISGTHDGEPRRKSQDSVEGAGCAEDGEDSSEEKISSAVFVPHQGLDDPSEITSQDSQAPARLAPGSRSLSHSKDFHPWLVKADEPEEEAEVGKLPHKHHEDIEPGSFSHEPLTPRLPAKAPASLPDAQVAVNELQRTSHTLHSSRALPSYSEEHVHDHQITPRQPLDAIELIPYKHQVGGHTTLWRFSKRAVCKQLNNRENEFYERIERDHRDLLPFLPRYIGVLNVTFQKRGRRKSMHKQDAADERKQLQDGASATSKASASPDQDVAVQAPQGPSAAGITQHRVISQSLQSTHVPVPTVTFLDNQHILPRDLLQPTLVAPSWLQRFRRVSASAQGGMPSNGDCSTADKQSLPLRPSLEDRHANSWGSTTVNKRLRNEVFNDAFLKQPINIRKHRRGHQRAVPRQALEHTLRQTASTSHLATTQNMSEIGDEGIKTPGKDWFSGKYERSPQSTRCSKLRDEHVEDIKDITGTSAPEPEILPATPPQRRKRRHSGTALRRRPTEVKDDRGNLIYFEEPDEVGFKADSEDNIAQVMRDVPPVTSKCDQREANAPQGTFVSSAVTSATNTGPPSPSEELKKIPRPINPKEAQTQHDPRVEYFLLLEDLTAGMKRPCIMDLKMGTRQYGVDATPKKQKSQQGKCAKTTSRELGVRVCGLQVWDVQTQSYVFKDKYFGRDLKAGQEFQDTLTRFLYDGVDPSSILRHIPTVLQKLSQLEDIIQRLRGYRFYAASLLMFYDGDTSSNDYDTSVEDSSTDFATDTEDVHRRRRRDKREIDFKMADFANSVTEGDLARDKPCPPQHPNGPDRGFLRGLRSLKKYFLKIQQDTRASMGLITRLRDGIPQDIDLEGEEDDDESVSE